MGASGIAFTPSCSKLGQVPLFSSSLHSCQLQCRSTFLAYPHAQVSCIRKRTWVWRKTQLCMSPHLGMESHVFQDFSVYTSIHPSSITEGDAEEFSTESGPEECTYDWHLPLGLCPNLMPKHVAIIMDGNSRWARKRGLPVTAGHEAGMRALIKIVKLSCKWGIRVLTLFAFSTENWFRPKTEVSSLMELLELILNKKLENLKRGNVRFSMIGDNSQLPNSLQRVLARVEESTKQNSGLKLIIAVSYSGRNDIVQGCQRLAEQVESGQLKSTEITESLFDQELETRCAEGLGSPDFLIRTSGEQRISNFLLWQLAYTELFFDDSLWPEFGEAQYAEALRSFQHRQRRYGKRIRSGAEDTSSTP
eukprot:Gb_00963 [translate_table: standard]